MNHELLRNVRHADARLGKEQRSNITAQRYKSKGALAFA
jgi:hypothetical protein